MSALARDGFRIKQATGEEWRLRGITAFSALDDWLKGDRAKLEKYADWSQSCGVNCWRVFLIWNNLRLKPTGPNYYQGIHDLGAWMNGRGLWLWVPFFCDQTGDTPDVLLTLHEQSEHFLNTSVALRDIHGPREGANEYFKNYHNVGMLPRLGPFCTRSAVQDTELPDAAGTLFDFTNHHSPRGPQQTRKFKELVDVAKLGFPGWQPSGRPALAGEGPRIAEGEWTVVQRVADYFAGCDLFGNGAVIHGGYAPAGHNNDLQRCGVPTDPTVLACIAAVSDVWRNGVPLGTFSDGSYLRGTAQNDGPLGINHFDRYTDTGENPQGALRTFAMQVGNRQIIVPVDRGPAWTIGLRNGFHVVEQRGHNGNVIIVEK